MSIPKKILKIRENFISSDHNINLIEDYDKIWMERINNWAKDKNDFKLSCKKISQDIDCIHFQKINDQFLITTSYLIGLDYLDKNFPFMVEPKFTYNQKDVDLDSYSILFNSLPYIKSNEDVSDLYFVDFSKPPITINQKDDFLTPIMIIQFISYLEKICHSGLQKGYYWVDENLDGKVKGKILIKETIRKNHLRANYSKTFCRNQEHGINTEVNQYLKFTFQFCLQFLSQFEKLNIIKNLESKIGFIKSSLENVSIRLNFRNELHVIRNPLFPLYENAIKTANLILKRFSYNIMNTSKKEIETYPYWINMSKLFEIHILSLLRQSLKSGIIYQKKYDKRIPDIVINREDLKIIIDAKYKPYEDKSLEIEDIRQVAAYSRMKQIFKEFNYDRTQVIDSVIIYPKIDSEIKKMGLNEINKKTELRDYFNIYKLEVDMPTIKTVN